MNNKIHFVGIGGVGMSSLAQHFLHLNFEVSGSDLKPNPLTDKLKNMGAIVHIGHRASNLPDGCQLLVHTSAVQCDNIELIEARHKNIPCILREQMLGDVFNGFEKRVAVSGVHGKTTTTSMIDFILRKCQVSHTSFVGGLVSDTNSNYTQGDGIVVAEACEFNKSFLHLNPNILVCLNVELDHPDCYPDEHAIEGAFSEFFANITPCGTVLACGDSTSAEILKNVRHLTFGLGQQNDYTAQNLVRHSTHYTFDFCNREQLLATVTLNAHGKHNVVNALAALVTCNLLGVDINLAAKSLSQFCGTQRRFMTVPCPFTNVVEDYAHHPTEIQALVDTAKCFEHKRIFAVFQPHTYTRTAAFWQRFSTCFDGVDELLLLPIFSARESAVEGISSKRLCKEVNNFGIPCKFFETPFDAYYYLTTVANNSDLVLIVGAGDIYELSELLKE